jgi:DNA segregation ATPase FtsK/SpoIIIE-like protein
MSKIFLNPMPILFLAFILTLTNPFVSWCAEPVSIDAQVDISQPTLGDILTYSITVTHDPDIVLHMPEYVIPEGLENVEHGKENLKNINKQTTQEFWLKLRVDKIGTVTLPSIPVWFDAPDTSKQIVRGKIMSPEINFEVQSLLQLEENASDIKDIKPIADIQAPWTHYIWKALAILCLLALGYFLWKKWQNKSTPKSKPDFALTAEEKAMKELDELQIRGWMKLGRIRDHFFELSEIFRRYLENRYEFPAQEWTTEEITTHFKNFSDLNESQKLQARTLLIEIDKVKFAKAQAHEDPIHSVIRFIKETSPVLVLPDQITPVQIIPSQLTPVTESSEKP